MKTRKILSVVLVATLMSFTASAQLAESFENANTVYWPAGGGFVDTQARNWTLNNFTQQSDQNITGTKEQSLVGDWSLLIRENRDTGVNGIDARANVNDNGSFDGGESILAHVYWAGNGIDDTGSTFFQLISPTSSNYIIRYDSGTENDWRWQTSQEGTNDLTVSEPIQAGNWYRLNITQREGSGPAFEVWRLNASGIYELEGRDTATQTAVNEIDEVRLLSNSIRNTANFYWDNVTIATDDSGETLNGGGGGGAETNKTDTVTFEPGSNTITYIDPTFNEVIPETSPTFHFNLDMNTSGTGELIINGSLRETFPVTASNSPYAVDLNGTLGDNLTDSQGYWKWRVHVQGDDSIIYTMPSSNNAGDIVYNQNFTVGTGLYQAFNLIDPADNTQFVADSGGTKNVDFLFEWITRQQDVEGVDFDLSWIIWNEAGNIYNQKNYNLPTGASSGEKSETLDIPVGNYAWGLKGTSDPGGTNYSENFTFSVLSQQSSPYNITLISPSDGATLTASSGDETDVNLVWEIEADEAGSYEVVSGQFTQPLLQGSVSTGLNEFNRTYSFPNDNFYTWKVEVTSDVSGQTYTSERFEFTLGDEPGGGNGGGNGGTPPGEGTFASVVLGIIEAIGGAIQSITSQLSDAVLFVAASIFTGIVGLYASRVTRHVEIGLLTMTLSALTFVVLGWYQAWVGVIIFLIASGLFIFALRKIHGGE